MAGQILVCKLLRPLAFISSGTKDLGTLLRLGSTEAAIVEQISTFCSDSPSKQCPNSSFVHSPCTGLHSHRLKKECVCIYIYVFIYKYVYHIILIACIYVAYFTYLFCMYLLIYSSIRVSMYF